MFILCLFIIPIVAISIIIFLKNELRIKQISLWGTIFQTNVIIALLLQYIAFKNNVSPVNSLFLEKNILLFSAIPINLHIGINSISLLLILLTNIISICGILMSWDVKKQPNLFFILLLILNIGAIGFFISYDLVILFLFLEIAVIPKFLLIYIWGTEKKQYSSLKLAIMLMFGSVLILIGIYYLYQISSINGWQNIDLIAFKNHPISFSNQLILFPFLFIGFSVFTAMFPFHSWVPDGHSSAPTAGSMFLAGISMKLGGYGCFLIACYLFPAATIFYAKYILILATISVLYGAFITLIQKDLKYLNAYSSISHCGFIIFGIAILNESTLKGSILQMISHGLMTTLFFATIGMIYKRTHTRKLSEMSGLLKSLPFISTMLILAGLTSLGLPGLSGFVAEMFIIMGAFNIHNNFIWINTVLISLSLILSSIYILNMIGKIIFGETNPTFENLPNTYWYEKTTSFILIICILFLGCLPSITINFIEQDIHQIIQSIISK